MMNWKRIKDLLLWGAVCCMPTMVAVNHFGSDPVRFTLFAIFLLWCVGMYRIESKLDKLLKDKENTDATSQPD